jgi:hypothetical protein
MIRNIPQPRIKLPGSVNTMNKFTISRRLEVTNLTDNSVSSSAIPSLHLAGVSGNAANSKSAGSEIESW